MWRGHAADELAGLKVHFVTHGGRGAVLGEFLHDQAGGERVRAQAAMRLRDAEAP
jgi:hypothetical protein